MLDIDQPNIIGIWLTPLTIENKLGVGIGLPKYKGTSNLTKDLKWEK